MKLPKNGRRCIYFIKSLDTDLVKVGISDNVKTRFSFLKGRTENGVELLALVPVRGSSFSMGEERLMHTIVRAKWAYGEWFRLNYSDITEACSEYRRIMKLRSVRMNLLYTLRPIYTSGADENILPKRKARP